MPSQWQMPLTHLTNGGAGYVEGVRAWEYLPCDFRCGLWSERQRGERKIFDRHALELGSGIELGH
jgi:hypothetical protein